MQTMYQFTWSICLNLYLKKTDSSVWYIIKDPWWSHLLNVDVLSHSCRLAQDWLNFMTDQMPMVISSLEQMYIMVDLWSGQSPSPPLLPLTTLRQTVRLALQLKRNRKWTKGSLNIRFLFFIDTHAVLGFSSLCWSFHLGKNTFILFYWYKYISIFITII